MSIPSNIYPNMSPQSNVGPSSQQNLEFKAASTKIPVALPREQGFPHENLPPSIASMLAAAVFTIPFSAITKMNPLKTFTVVSLHIYVSAKLDSFTDNYFPQDKLRTGVLKIVAFIATQVLFKAIYRKVGMFTKPVASLFYWGLTTGAGIVLTRDIYKEYKK
jgi:hypothetical protein